MSHISIFSSRLSAFNMASRTKPLPIIKSSYDEGGEGTGPLPQTWRSPRGSDPHTPRLNYLEDRLQAQERTTQNLIDRAYKIKENIIDNLNITHGTWQEEKRSRELLQEHIRTITDIVRKLSRDIQVGQLCMTMYSSLLEQKLFFCAGKT